MTDASPSNFKTSVINARLESFGGPCPENEALKLNIDTQK